MRYKLSSHKTTKGRYLAWGYHLNYIVVFYNMQIAYAVKLYLDIAFIRQEEWSV